MPTVDRAKCRALADSVVHGPLEDVSNRSIYCNEGKNRGATIKVDGIAEEGSIVQAIFYDKSRNMYVVIGMKSRDTIQAYLYGIGDGAELI